MGHFVSEVVGPTEGLAPLQRLLQCGSTQRFCDHFPAFSVASNRGYVVKVVRFLRGEPRAFLVGRIGDKRGDIATLEK